MWGHAFSVGRASAAVVMPGAMAAALMAGASTTAADGKTFTRKQVEQHTTPETGIYVTYKESVYDITEFVANHPGGTDKIMMAAGKAIDPYWRIYQQHTNSATPSELLAAMKIGELDKSEAPTVVDESDPYSSDPERHPGLLFHNTKPANAELPPALAMQDWVTPADLWFIRHHHPVPEVKGAEYALKANGLGIDTVKEEGFGADSLKGGLKLSLDGLKERFEPTEVTTTIQCGGNRRGGFNHIAKTSGIAWQFGAISTAVWKGVLLREVLEEAGLTSPKVAEKMGVKHIIFKAIDGLQASIPVEKALNPYGDVLLAYEMNGEPLPREHGYPLRLVVPGSVGIRNVKWVGEITTSDVEAVGPWQRGIAYKGFSPNVKSFEGVDVEKVLSMHEMPVQSAIVSPISGTKVAVEDKDANETVTVAGWAWSGGGRGIVRVDVSTDGGKTWNTAELGEGKDQNPSRAWAWTFWELELPVPSDALAKGGMEICCRATDASYCVQPESPEKIWNIRGLNNVSWHRVQLPVVQEVEE
mmetsp:Transcript_36653/g.98187  ORF Transcript_36653/g.98187 Transcript_36653/m.98187 type:complete len:529 (-) Transcript_36653:232-1818(-)|eukprot:CAMPEP_0119476456 /NCGR_PEP_ID=MMETSP1344-20130328/6972_1 /TAXON_ID=236787 /ORGANISM="Florenciella parvula, Strain CCMP2471" /LENGTH=528 /DNA_ID=CAMNT_0007510231 /DNA_START=792 /DNA_END=2378 /DNA_ORIENTATION=+